MSLRYILVDTSFFDNEGERDNSERCVLVFLEALTMCNQYFLQDHPETPGLYAMYDEGKIKYKLPAQMDSDPVEFKGEHFRTIPRIIENGGGDCDNIACWRAAELRKQGIAARPYITKRPRPGGGTIYHVIVQWPDGSSEDPCLLIGMAPERTEEIENERRKMRERVAEEVAGQLQRRDNPSTILGERARKKNALVDVMGWFLRAR